MVKCIILLISKARNELLNQQLEEATNSSSAMNRRAVENLEAHLNEASSQLFEIQKKYTDTLSFSYVHLSDFILYLKKQHAKTNKRDTIMSCFEK